MQQTKKNARRVVDKIQQKSQHSIQISWYSKVRARVRIPEREVRILAAYPRFQDGCLTSEHKDFGKSILSSDTSLIPPHILLLSA